MWRVMVGSFPRSWASGDTCTVLIMLNVKGISVNYAASTIYGSCKVNDPISPIIIKLLCIGNFGFHFVQLTCSRVKEDEQVFKGGVQVFVGEKLEEKSERERKVERNKKRKVKLKFALQ